MLKLLAVGTGGFIGAMLRYLVSGWVQRLAPQSDFPFGTLTVNIVGCLIIGLLGGLNYSREIFSPQARLVIFIGILGSFTTFSTFGYETVAMLRDGQFIPATINIATQIIIGLLAVIAGYSAAAV